VVDAFYHFLSREASKRLTEFHYVKNNINAMKRKRKRMKSHGKKSLLRNYRAFQQRKRLPLWWELIFLSCLGAIFVTFCDFCSFCACLGVQANFCLVCTACIQNTVFLLFCYSGVASPNCFGGQKILGEKCSILGMQQYFVLDTGSQTTK